MKTLFLLRHAKSDWTDESLPDFERPLNERGREACETISDFLKEENIQPELIICSPAARARETIKIIMRTAQLQSALRFDERIYEASLGRLMGLISQIENEAESALLVGHNPGFEQLVKALSGRNETMPTAALAKITLRASNWSSVPAGGTLDWIVRPKELAAS